MINLKTPYCNSIQISNLQYKFEQSSIPCWCKWFLCHQTPKSQRRLAPFDHRHGVHRGTDRYTWKTSCCFQQGAHFGRDNWASAESPPPYRPPAVPLLWFPHAQSHFCLCSLSSSSLLLSHFVPVGQPRRQHLGLLALLEVGPQVDYAPLQLREGARGLHGLPSGAEIKEKRIGYVFCGVYFWEGRGSPRRSGRTTGESEVRSSWHSREFNMCLWQPN